MFRFHHLPGLLFCVVLLSGCGKEGGVTCKGPPDVLLFNGKGADDSSWSMLESILMRKGHCYELADGPSMNRRSLEEISQYRLLIFPGGFGDTITYELTPKTRLRIREAVRMNGVSFLGVCAGAWIAVGPEAASRSVARYGLAVAKGPHLDLYLPNGRSEKAAIVKLDFASGNSRSVVWWGGPSTPEWNHGVIARYPTGEPAISQTFAGKGFVVVTGPHPEADLDWYEDSGPDPDGLDHDIAYSLIQAAYDRAPLPAFQ